MTALGIGLHPNVPAEEYFAYPAINQSILKYHSSASSKANHAELHPKAPTDAQEFGTAYHTSLLEPKEFPKNYIAPPKCDRRTKIGKTTWNQFIADNPNKIHLTHKAYTECIDMREAALKHRTASSILAAPGQYELMLVWNDPLTGLLCKARIDKLCKWRDYTCVVDLKTTKNASQARNGFPQEAARYDYAFQAAWYLDGLNEAAGKFPRRFIWIAGEKTAPWEVNVFEPSLEMIASGRRDYRRAVRKHKECLDSGIWPGYGDDAVHTIDLPDWALSEVEYDDGDEEYGDDD